MQTKKKKQITLEKICDIYREERLTTQREGGIEESLAGYQ